MYIYIELICLYVEIIYMYIIYRAYILYICIIYTRDNLHIKYNENTIKYSYT